MSNSIWATDEDFGSQRKASNSIYPWAKCARLAITKPGEWLLVHECAPPSSASNVNAGRVRVLRSPEFAGWVFTARVSKVSKGPIAPRAKIWIKAEPRRI